MNIDIKVIPHNQQRYETVGDWFYTKSGNLSIRVSELGDWRYELLVAIHELIEVALCRYSHITQLQADNFDIAYEKARKRGDESEPGDDPACPYRIQHLLATGIEKILAALLNVDWQAYDKKVMSL